MAQCPITKNERNFEAELTEIWDICIGKLFDKHIYINDLENLLRSKGVTEQTPLLDSCGGQVFQL